MAAPSRSRGQTATLPELGETASDGLTNGTVFPSVLPESVHALRARRIQGLTRLDDLVRWTGRLTLEERDGALVAHPRATWSGAGWVVSDLREFEVRLYDSTGALRARYGRKGSGPGEYPSPPITAHARGDVVSVADFSGRLHQFSSPDSVTSTQLPFFPLYEARAIGGSRVLLAGWGPMESRTQVTRTQLIHEWDASTRRVVRSFFPMPVPDSLLGAARTFGSVTTDLRGDSLLVAHALSDTLVVFSLRSGAVQRRYVLPSPFFKRIRAPLTPIRGPEDRRKWTETFSVIDAVHWVSGGRVMIQFSEASGTDRAYRLVLFDADGSVLAQLRDAPQLRGVRVTGTRSLLYVQDPTTDEPNSWRVGELLMPTRFSR